MALPRQARDRGRGKRGPITLIEDEATRKCLVGAFRKGLPMPLCAALAGVNVATVARWFDDGSRDLEAGRKTPAADLVRDARKAEAEHAAVAMSRVNAAGKYEWRAAAWSLERRHGFASSSKVEVSGAADNDTAIRVDVDLSKLSVEKLRALAYDDDPDDK